METFTLILGLTAAFLTTFAYLPQSVKSIRTKETKDLSLPMVIMLECGLIIWLAYGIMIQSIPIIAANTVSLVLMTIILVLKLRFG
jgi:MtN3 and saliva related transmembrane protein